MLRSFKLVTAGVFWGKRCVKTPNNRCERDQLIARKLVILVYFSLVSDFVLIFCFTAFEKALILLYVERKQKKKDRDRVS